MTQTTVELDERRLRLDEVVGAYYEAVDRGSEPDLNDLQARHPDLAGELAEFLDDQRAFRRLIAPVRLAARGTDLTLTLTERPDGDVTPAPDSGHAATEVDPGDGVGRTETAPAGRAAPSTPTRLGDFELVRRLGQGAMGIVYEARQISLNRTVAVKMIRAGVFATGAELQRFRLEAEAVAHLDHPRIVPIHAVGEDHDFHYFSMKLIPGGNLAQHLSEFTADPRAAARLLIEVARAIQHAHERGILHRDLKPANILLDEQGRPNVTDFGLAKRFGADSSLTQSGAILGTPSYMAPEQAGGRKKAVTALTDVYGLGAVLYALLTGRAPFAADTILETIEQVRNRPPVPPSRLNTRVCRDLETVCLKCLEKDPWRRYASAGALADDLQRWVDGVPIAARPVAATTRAWMWCRRNPIVSSLLAAMILFAVGITWQWRRARLDASSAAVDRALSFCDQGEVGRGMLLLAKALESAPYEMTGLKRAIRANMVAWSQHQTRLTNVIRQTSLVKEDAGHAVHFVTFSPDGRTAVTLSRDQTARLLDAFTGEPRGEALQHGGGSVAHAAFSPDNRFLVTGGSDHTARLWTVETGRPVGGPLRHSGLVRSVAFSPDGLTFLTGSNDGNAQLWDFATLQQLGAPLRHKRGVYHVAFRPDDGNVAVTGDDGGDVRLWDLRTRRVIGEPFRCESSYQAFTRPHVIACSNDGRSILTGGFRRSERERGAQFSDATTGRPIGGPLLHEDVIRAVALSRCGDVAITGSDDRTARLWDARTGDRLCLPLQHQGQVLAVALNDQGTRALTGSGDKTARLWTVPKGAPVGDLIRHPGQVLDVAFRPDGRAVLTGCDDGCTRLWTLAPPDPTGTPAPASELNGVRHLALFPDGKTTLMGGKDGEAWVCDAATLIPTDNRPLKNEYTVRSVAVSRDGARLLTGCVDGSVRVWSSMTHWQIGSTMFHKGPVHSVAFSPDGGTVVTGGGDQTARVWDAATGKPIGPPLLHDTVVDVVAFEGSGKAVLTCTEKGWRRWELAPEATGPDERFVLWAQVSTGSEIDSADTVSSLDAEAWIARQDRLRALGGPPVP